MVNALCLVEVMPTYRIKITEGSIGNWRLLQVIWDLGCVHTLDKFGHL